MAKYDQPRVAQLYLSEFPKHVDIRKYRYRVTVTSQDKKRSLVSDENTFIPHSQKTRPIEVYDDTDKVQIDIYLNKIWMGGYILRHYQKNAKIAYDQAKIKSTTASNSEKKNHIKEVHLKDSSDCGYIILMSFEIIDSFLKRIYKNKPTAKDYSVFRTNNSHIDALQSGNLNEKLRPGQVIILSHSTITSTNPKLKAMKELALKVEQELAKQRKDPRFDERFHAIHNELLIDIIEEENISVEGVISEAEYKKSLAEASIKYDNNGCVIGSVNVDGYELPSVNIGYETMNAFLLTAEQVDNYEKKSNAKIRLQKEAHLEAMNRYNRLAELAEQYQKNRRVNLATNYAETQRFVAANKYSLDALDKSLQSKFLAYEVRKDYARFSNLLVSGNGVIGVVDERLYVYEKMIKQTTGLSTALRWGGRIMLMWTVVEAGKTVAAATKKNNNVYTRKVIFVETAKAEAALVGGAAGAILSKRLVGFLGITPHAKVGQVVITIGGMASAVGLSVVVDKALYKTMGLCK